jgi:ATP-dependent helicase/nuclease subunit A
MTPNSEQQLAIDSNGNTCLFAGAGAGKTFVIKEHIFRVVKEQVLKISQECVDNEIYEKELRSYLSKVAVITFTKKAAREIKIRVEGKFIEADFEGLTAERKEMLKNEIGHLYVGTIHSYFFKLIREFSLNVDEETVDIKNEYQIKQAINNFVKDSMESFIEDENFTRIAKIHPRMSSSLYELANDVQALAAWEKGGEKYQLSFNELINLYGINLGGMTSDLSEFTGKDTQTKWFELLTFINDNCIKVNDYKSLSLFMAELGTRRMGFPRGKKAESLSSSISEIKKFNEFSKDCSAFVKEVGEHPEYIQAWQSIYLDMASRTKDYLENNNFFGFSDIEKLLLKLLQDESIRENVNSNVKYLVVDEYQDTSSIQFEIINKIINGDLSKLYVVGDPKQSIYSFRGGEISVFFETARLLENKCVMKNNYRSTEAVINFNNALFEALLSELGSDYPDIALEVSQVHGNLDLINGSVAKITPAEMPEDLKKFPAEDLEDEFLKKQIGEIKKNHPNDKVAILVRKVKHAMGLAKQLINEKVGVSFQLKLYGDESPVILFFKNMIELAVIKKKDRAKCLERVNRDLAYFNYPVEALTEESIVTWKKEINLFGVENAFIKLTNKLGIQSIGYAEQFELLEILILSCLGNLEQIWQKLKFSGDSSLALEIQTASEPKYHFMTVHSSKGLEFDHVILGGLYKSQKSRPDTNLMSGDSRQFSFPSKINGDSIKTPEYMLATKKQKLAGAEESLRLFYVACTRAIKTLSFVHFPGVKAAAGSWIKDVESVFPSVQDCMTSVEFPITTPDKENIQEFELIINGEQGNTSYVFPEVSVSKLSDLVVCPKLFYLKNVLKLTPDFDSYASEKAVSSAERGTEVHLQLEHYVEGKEDNLSGELSWATEKIDKLRKLFELFPEEDVKFKVQGQMISGTIDLLGQSGNKLVVVDYKTGKFDLLQNSKYFFQALLYAKAALTNFTKTELITLEIWYVDLKKSMRYELYPEDIDQVITFFWDKMNDYSVTNPSHCKKCFLNNICL